jgi:8-oxo-dGTP pyrophosphatase MutT (NUDIX family)
MKIGEGCWNGYGGGVEVGETPEMAAVRELQEESGSIVREEDLEKVGLLKVHNHKSDGRIVLAEIRFYVARQCEGVVKETPEMITPTWFFPHEIPLEALMPADKLWLPRALAGERLVVTVHYGPFQKEILEPVRIEQMEQNWDS